MKLLFIYVDDFKDALRCQLEKTGQVPTDAEFDILSKQAKTIYGPNNPISGNPRLGILTLASVLRNHFGKKIEIQQIDMGLECFEPNDLRWKLREFQPDVVGLSCMLPFANVFHKATSVIHKVLPNATIIAGGPYISSAPKRALTDKFLTAGVMHEGEETLPHLLEILMRGGDLSSVPGIVYREHGDIKFTSPRPLVQDLNVLPLPAVDLIDINQYSKAYRVLSTPSKSMPLFSSRGCPYECTFCHNLSGKTVRWRSAENVFSEMDHYYKEYGVKEFFFWDDIFNLNIKRAHQLCDAILKSKMKIRFAFPRGMRGDILTFDLIDKMVEAGLYMTSFAVESASPRIQKMIKKYNDFGKLSEVIHYTVEKGVLVNTFNMVDFPTETEEDMRMTLEFNQSLPHHDAQLFKVSPFEGTELYDQIGGYDHQEHLGAATFYKYHKKLLSKVSPEFFQNFIKEFGLKFYFDPKRLLNNQNFKSPHVSDEELRHYFKNIYGMAQRHYGIKNKEIRDPQVKSLLGEMCS